MRGAVVRPKFPDAPMRLQRNPMRVPRASRARHSTQHITAAPNSRVSPESIPWHLEYHGYRVPFERSDGYPAISHLDIRALRDAGMPISG